MSPSPRLNGGTPGTAGRVESCTDATPIVPPLAVVAPFSRAVAAESWSYCEARCIVLTVWKMLNGLLAESVCTAFTHSPP